MMERAYQEDRQARETLSMSAGRDVCRHRHLGDIELEPADHSSERVDEWLDLHEFELAAPWLHCAVLEGLVVSLGAGDGSELGFTHGRSSFPREPVLFAGVTVPYSHGMSEAWITSGTPWPPTDLMARSTSFSPNVWVVTFSSGKRFDASC